MTVPPWRDGSRRSRRRGGTTRGGWDNEEAMRRRVRLLGLVLSLVLPAALGSGCAGRSGEQTLTVGAAAPALRTVAHDGTVIDLSERQGKPMLVYFYTKDDTPGCTKEACAFRDVWARYEEAGVRLVGVSADDNESHREFAKEHALPFPLIADEELVWANAFGVDTTLGMTNRDSFLIGADGKVAKVYRGVDPGVHADEVLADAKALGGG
jgi:thioredoxin-dependent peroxiredoxin